MYSQAQLAISTSESRLYGRRVWIACNWPVHTNKSMQSRWLSVRLIAFVDRHSCNVLEHIEYHAQTIGFSVTGSALSSLAESCACVALLVFVRCSVLSALRVSTLGAMPCPVIHLATNSGNFPVPKIWGNYNWRNNYFALFNCVADWYTYPFHHLRSF